MDYVLTFRRLLAPVLIRINAAEVKRLLVCWRMLYLSLVGPNAMLCTRRRAGRLTAFLGTFLVSFLRISARRGFGGRMFLVVLRLLVTFLGQVVLLALLVRLVFMRFLSRFVFLGLPFRHLSPPIENYTIVTLL